MHETRADYGAFREAVDPYLAPEHHRFLDQSSVRRLFLHDVHHPQGYRDGVSGVSKFRHVRRTQQLTNNDRKDLTGIARRVIATLDFIPEGEHRAHALLGANQLLQNARWNRHPLETDKYVSEIADVYEHQRGTTVQRIQAWDAQIAENRSIYHMQRSQYGLMGSMLGCFLSLSTTMFADANGYDAFSTFGEITANGSIAAIVASYSGTRLGLHLQDTSVDRSPNTSTDLITDRHYRFLRHPLYAIHSLGSVVGGFMSANPVGIASALFTAREFSEVVAAQDERMRILHGQKAAEYQQKTSAFIPGIKSLVGLIRKSGLDSLADILDTPIHTFLPQNAESLNGNQGSPNYETGTSLERKTRYAPLTIGNKAIIGNSQRLANIFVGLGKSVYGLGKVLVGRSRSFDFDQYVSAVPFPAADESYAAHFARKS